MKNKGEQGELPLKSLTLRVNVDDWKTLRVIAAEQCVTSREVLMRGLEMVFELYGKQLTDPKRMVMKGEKL